MKHDLKLHWYKPRKCWRKRKTINGVKKEFYFSAGKGKSDRGAYKKAQNDLKSILDEYLLEGTKIAKCSYSTEKATREWWNEYRKRFKCTKCGNPDHEILEFHHRDAKTKKYSISRMVDSNMIRTVLDELEKCDPLCCNCHRKHHINQIKQKKNASIWKRLGDWSGK